MYKNAHRLLACLLSFLLLIDTASAGWLIGNCFRSMDCCDPCEVQCCCVPVSCWEPCVDPCAEQAPVEEPSCCYSDSSESSEAAVEMEAPMPVLADDEPHEPTPAPVMEVAPVPELESEGFSSAPIAEMEEPVELEAPPEPVVTEFVEPMPAEVMPEEPATFTEPEVMAEPEVFAEPEVMEEPEMVVEEPVEEEDLFGGFGEEPVEEEAPMEETPMEETSVEEDLFSGFGEDTAPMEEPVEEMAPEEEVMEESTDDLFGGFGDDAPAEEPEMMPEEMAAEEDDLFGGFGETAEEEAPMEEETPTEEDLFGGFGEEDTPMEEPAEEMAPEEDAMDDLFGGFSEEAAPAEEATEEAADDLFGDFAEEAEDTAEEVLDPPAEETPNGEDDEAFDDLFGGFSSVLQEPGGYQSDENRNWVDNTGSFSCVARLVSVDGNSVLLAKPTGKMATVPLARLSQADLEFVNRQALAQQQVETVHVAQR